MKWGKTNWVTAGLLAVFINEATGYNAFDWGGTNIACSIDPTCRKLSDEEIEFARQFFGDDIDYEDVNYFTRNPFFGLMPRQNTIARSVFGNIYETKPEYFESAPVKNDVFAHEMHHVWQYQTKPFLEMFSKVSGHDDVYEFDIDDYETFEEFGVEQQAEIIQFIAAYREVLNSYNDRPGVRPNLIAPCERLNKLEEKAAQELPIEITDCTQYDPNIPEI